MANNNNNLTRSKRYAVRAAIVTASTVATIVGAQSLALMDAHSLKLVSQTTTTTAAVPTAAALANNTITQTTASNTAQTVANDTDANHRQR